MKDDLLLILNVDFNTSSSKDGDVRYMETTSDKAILEKASKKIEFFTWKAFRATQVFIVDYDGVKAEKTGKIFR